MSAVKTHDGTVDKREKQPMYDNERTLIRICRFTKILLDLRFVKFGDLF